jgi:hypothetical protein
VLRAARKVQSVSASGREPDSTITQQDVNDFPEPLSYAAPPRCEAIASGATCRPVCPRLRRRSSLGQRIMQELVRLYEQWNKPEARPVPGVRVRSAWTRRGLRHHSLPRMRGECVIPSQH